MTGARNLFDDLIPKSAASPNQATQPQTNANPFSDLVDQAGASARNPSVTPETPYDTLPLPIRIAMGLAQGFGTPSADKSKMRDIRTTAMKQGLKDLGQGVTQASLAATEGLGIVPEGSTLNYTREVDPQRAAYNASEAGQDPFAKTLRTGASNAPLGLIPIPALGEAGLLAKAGMGSLTGAATSDLQYVPEGESRAKNVAAGALIGAGIPFAKSATERFIGGPGSMGPAFQPSAALWGRFASTPLTNQQIQRNLEAASGTETGIGAVLGLPIAHHLNENLFSRIPGSGANAAMQRTSANILDKGHDILNGFLGNMNPSEVKSNLGEALVNAAKYHTDLKNNLYKESNQIADNINFSPSVPTFSALVNRHINAIDNTNILQFEPDMRALMGRLANYKNGIESPVSLEEANIMAGRLKEMAAQYGKSTTIADRNAAKVFGQLGTALKNDVRNSVNKSGSKELINSFYRAEKNYEKNYSDFLEKDIHDFTSGKKHPDDLVSTFIVNSRKSDKANQLNKLMSALPQDAHDMVRYSYFSRAMDGPEDMKVVNPEKLSTLWKNLGDEQKKILMPDKAKRRQMDNFSLLVSMNKRAVNLMLNPLNGQVNSDIVTGLMLAHPISALKEIGLARYGTTLMTSEEARQRVAEGIMRRRRGNP